ncbi:MAG TPA: hypothetical protein VML54_13710, partial [Candidatus Limnocylindrales bacterium]|nr:hypothetical protein [Candidatus Limnocylindrales bacterium]
MRPRRACVKRLLASGLQLDVYGNPGTGARIECEIGTFDDCVTINANGSLGGAFGGSTDGFALITALLYAYKSTEGDLATFIAQTPAPAAAVL